MTRKRISTLLVLLSLVTALAAGGWLAGTGIKSPAEVAARTAPPTPSPILVPVEERVLSSKIVTRGTARFVQPQSVSLSPSLLKSGPGLVTTLPESGSQIHEGDVLLGASGRPVLVLRGSTPAYRDLTPGIRGEDVRQLEAGLQRLGFEPGVVDGDFDEATSAAVARWYESRGWEPFGPTVEQLRRVRTLEAELADVTSAKLVATAAAAPLAVEAAKAHATSADKAAASNVAAAVSTHERVMTDGKASTADRVAAETALALARSSAKATKLAGELGVQAALDAQRAARREAKLAAELESRLSDEVALARSRTGIQVPVDEIVFLSSLPVRVERLRTAVGEAALGIVVQVTSNQLAIDSSLPLDEAPLVKAGMPVTIDEASLGIEARGVVQRVGDAPGTDGVDGYHIYMETFVEETRSKLQGFSLRLTIPIESTEGAVTAVPVSALSLAADGSSRVQVDRGGTLEYLVVEPGLAANGFVAVEPLDGELVPGQLVVVGYETYYEDEPQFE